jgi:dephospho-CoA kinase
MQRNEMTEADFMESIQRSLRSLFESSQVINENLLIIAKTLEAMGVVEVVITEKKDMQ